MVLPADEEEEDGVEDGMRMELHPPFLVRMAEAVLCCVAVLG